mmetsp:Transcript_1279/g.2313  ORF Transcript_1279/g.2313 Transcript_1279/m.2313 type:complete len:150 (-) Transcript_1279:291-740(-)
MPAYVDVFKLIKDNVDVGRVNNHVRLMPFVFYTDGGVDKNCSNYFMHQLFGEGQFCYCTETVYTNLNATHLQAYLGREAAHKAIQPKNYFKSPEDKYIIQLPIEQFLLNKSEHETFKQLKILTIDKQMTSYTAFCKAFMIFTNEKEVSI